MQSKKYFLDQDQSSHWYLVDNHFREQWNTFKNLDEDNPLCWNTPEYASMIGCHPNKIIFENPIDL